MTQLQVRDAIDLSAPAPLSIGTTIAIAVAGSVVLIACVTIGGLFWREKRRHNRLLRDLERQGVNAKRRSAHSKRASLMGVQNVLRASLLVEPSASTAWQTLGSTEDITTTKTNTGGDPRRTTSSLGWPFAKTTQPGVALALTSLSAVSIPRSAEATTTNLSNDPTVYQSQEQTTPPATTEPSTIANTGSIETPLSLLRPAALFSAVPAANGELKVTKRRARARTIAATVRPIDPSDPAPSPGERPKMHSRSISLGAGRPGVVPDAPIPPLPLNVKKQSIVGRPKSWADRSISRISAASSTCSIGSSLLATSPALTRSHSTRTRKESDTEWEAARTKDPRPVQNGGKEYLVPEPHHASNSIQSDMARFSVISEPDHGVLFPEQIPMESDLQLEQPLNLQTAEAISMNLIQRLSTNGDKNDPLRTVQTPRRNVPKSLVTPNGSPAARTQLDVSDDQGVLTRQPSQTSTISDSCRSSVGNPFRYDPSPMASNRVLQKNASPAAARKVSHRRQNCVRIAFSPSVSGTRRISPSPSMGALLEEASEAGADEDEMHLTTSSAKVRSLPQPPSTSHSKTASHSAPHSYRASLTADSPTLPLNRYQDPCLGRNGSVDLTPTVAPLRFHKKKLSDDNSLLFNIPTFPSPAKNSAYSQLSPPTFAFIRPSDEYDRERTWDTPEEFKLVAQPIEQLMPKPRKSGSGASRVVSPRQVSHESRFPLLELDESGSPVGTRTQSVDVPSASESAQTSATLIGGTWSPLQQSPPQSPTESMDDLITASPEPGQQSYSANAEAEPLSPRSDQSTPTGSGERKSRPTSLHGPRSLQASPLKAQITKLRRMNSDAKDPSDKDRGSTANRRYLNLGREASLPTFEVDEVLQHGRPVHVQRFDSWMSMNAVIDHEVSMEKLDVLVDEEEEEAVAEVEKQIETDFMSIHGLVDIPLEEEEEKSLMRKQTDAATPVARKDSQTLPTAMPRSARSGTPPSMERDRAPSIQGLGLGIGTSPFTHVSPATPRSPTRTWENSESFWSRHRVQDENSDPRSPLPGLVEKPPTKTSPQTSPQTSPSPSPTKQRKTPNKLVKKQGPPSKKGGLRSLINPRIAELKKEGGFFSGNKSPPKSPPKSSHTSLENLGLPGNFSGLGDQDYNIGMALTTPEAKLMDPKRFSMGYGMRESSPGQLSLYDGDGFLKE